MRSEQPKKLPTRSMHSGQPKECRSKKMKGERAKIWRSNPQNLKKQIDV
jgi:hypothetical protein